jgi:phosphoribosylformylglycinamidine synthase
MKKFKSEIKITLREGILDVQGKTVENALHSMGLQTITHIRIGKFVTTEIEAENYDGAYEIIDKACKQLIANPIMEDYTIELKEL